MPTRRRSGGEDERITVLLADGQPFFARRLAASLAAEPDIALVAQSSDGDASVRRADVFRPQVALVDSELRTSAGRSASDAIGDASPSTRVLVLVSAAVSGPSEVGRSDMSAIASAIRSVASEH